MVPSAQLKNNHSLSDYDYRLGTTLGASTSQLLFPADTQTITFTFFLNSDTISEGVEGFRASSTPVEGLGIPAFQSPTSNFGSGTVFQNTEIHIIDNDCKSINSLVILKRGNNYNSLTILSKMAIHSGLYRDRQ